MYVRVEKVGRAGGRRVRCIAPWPGIELAEGKGEGIACRTIAQVIAMLVGKLPSRWAVLSL